MNVQPGLTPYQMAEDLYRQGLAAVVLRRWTEALWCFRSALKLYRSSGALTSWRCLSYFGMSLAMGEGAHVEAIRACQSALKNDREDGQLYLNLGRVYATAGRRGKAIEVFQAGLAVEPRHAGLQEALRTTDRRGKPVLPMLARSHPLNVYLGKARAKRRGCNGAAHSPQAHD